MLAFHSWPLIFRENCRRDLFILNEWNSIGTLFASWECVCFKKSNWIFFTIATGMEVIFCLLSINAIPHPSRKSLVSSKPCCIFPPLLLLTWIKRTRKKVFFFFCLCLAGRSSSPVELQLVGPNYPKARLSLSPSFCIFPRSSSERNPITKSIFKLSFYSFFFFFLQILMGTWYNTNNLTNFEEGLKIKNLCNSNVTTAKLEGFIFLFLGLFFFFFALCLFGEHIGCSALDCYSSVVFSFLSTKKLLEGNSRYYSSQSAGRNMFVPLSLFCERLISLVQTSFRIM